MCKWIESGNTVDTALPELSGLTDDKENWRAIIVRYIDDNCMAAFETEPRNPYDFLINKNGGDGVGENPVPLVRLAQMLGGVPDPEAKFEPEIIKEELKAPRTVYVPVRDEQKEREHKKLVEQYRFNGKLPSSVLIISVRDKSACEESAEQAQQPHMESASSLFWKRNRFPGLCRFLAFDFENRGPVQKDADVFGFWYAVMLMSVNEWDPSTLQAYRLYSLGIDMDRPEMTDSFQILADRLRDAKKSIEKSIRTDLENQAVESEELPGYRVNVTVPLKLPKTEERLVKKNTFALFSKGAASELGTWSAKRNEAEEEFAEAVKAAERALDHTADKMRVHCGFDEDEVEPLNKYQLEDLTRETGELYRRIVDIQGLLPDESLATDEEVLSASEKVKKNLLGRTPARPVVVSLVIVLLLVLLTSVPGIVDYFKKDLGMIQSLACFVCCSVLIAAVCGFCALFAQKAELNSLIERYNWLLKSSFFKLTENAADYSNYISAIASHSRGCSYLDISRRKKQYIEKAHYTKYKHIKAINILLGKLKTWSKAFRLDVDYLSKRPDISIDVDIETSPIENKLYLFATVPNYSVAINNSGLTMESPYPFADRISIVREELYEDE